MNEPIRVVVVDDHELFRRGVIATLRDSGRFLVEGEGSSAADALALARTLLPDLVLLDIHLPDALGLDIVPRLQVDCPVSRIVMLTVEEDDAMLLRAMREGASGYILKGVAADELVRAIADIAAGGAYVSPRLAAHLLKEMQRRDKDREALGGLSARERDVLEGLARGETNREIAAGLGLSEKTVKYYVTNVLIKLHVRNRVEAALLARKTLDGDASERPRPSDLGPAPPSEERRPRADG